jgi:putative membrane protein (TIGR04086 family)
MKGDKNVLLKAILRGVLYAVITSLVLVLLLALVIRLTGMADAVIKPVVQVIKVLSVFVGVAVALRDVAKRGYIWGAVVGLVYTVLTFFIFSILDNSFSITTGLPVDMLFALAVGAASSMLVRVMRASVI